LRRFRLAPITPAAMLISGVLSNFLLVIPTIVVQILCAGWIFHMPGDVSFAAAGLLSAAGIFTFSALGLIVASVTNTMQETQVVNNALWLMFLFLSGATIPLPIYPPFIQEFALFLPSTYLVTELQRALGRNYEGGLGLVEAMGSLAASFLLAFVISSRLFRWEPDQKYPARAKVWVVIAFIPFLIVGSLQVAGGHRLRDAREAFRAITERGETQQDVNQK
jgi:ABC-2 type transport system permease protein